MALSNHERVARALEQLTAGLVPYVERELQARLGPEWRDDLASRLRLAGALTWDAELVLRVLEEQWTSAFKFALGEVERSHVIELRQQLARHDGSKPYTSEDALRFLDTAHRLLEAVSAREEAEELFRHKTDLQRAIFADQARSKSRQMTLIEGDPKKGLQPWREVVTPHRDVASGRYLQAEFAADLATVHKGEGSAEYRDPVEFYRRTFVTAGLRELLVTGLRRLTGQGGDPVIELQTNFGGGKTHSMLALYHLFSGVPSAQLEGIEGILAEAGVDQAPGARRAVLVGTALSPAKVTTKPDGVKVRTLWGEMAWQLGGAEGYAYVREADETGTSPGSDDLAELFRACSPCLVLIDEWVAYARQLDEGKKLPAGDFDAQDSFAQALTEAAKRAPQALVVASIPQSRVEVGGERGERALEVLKDVFRRVAKAWRPASADEGFEIVRRRLFEPISGKEKHVERDAVVRAFAKMYRDESESFPSGVSEPSYEHELRSAYPIHPELFHRLYGDWSTLDKFQRTRGVLRLLAKVIHRLWESQDQQLLILPSSVPLDDAGVKSELTTYLSDVWEPIISQDVDGPHSLPLEIERNNRNLGRYSACRRVTRALYMGTAPGVSGKTPGVGDQHIRLACVQPGEAIPTFGDALRYLVQRAQYIQHDGNRYWISTRPNLNRTAADRAAALLREPEELYPEVVKRIRADKGRGKFSRVHACPEATSEIPDDTFEARLIILGPKQGHRPKRDDTPALQAAREFLDKRGNAPRQFRNTLVFLAPDQRNVGGVLEAVADYQAWKSIADDSDRLDLAKTQVKQAEAAVREKNETLDLRLAETWCYALAPVQNGPTEPIEWETYKLSKGDGFAVRVSDKLVPQEILLPECAGSRLRIELDNYLWSSRDHVSFADLATWFPSYLYLSRLKDAETLKQAIIDGATTTNVDDGFVVADGYDEKKQRYLNLRFAQAPAQITNSTVLVKPDVARSQRDAESQANSGTTVERKDPAAGRGGGGVTPPDPWGTEAGTDGTPRRPTPPDALPTTFFGSIGLDPVMAGLTVGKIVENVVEHLTKLDSADARLTLEIRIDVPDGIPKDVQSIVRENCTTLKFDVHELS